MRNAANAFFGDHAADLIGNLLNVRLADSSAGFDRNLLDDLFRNHATDGVRNLRHDRFGNHTANGDWTRLTHHLRLISRAGNLSFDDVRTPDSAARVKSGHLSHADLRATARSGHQSWTARTGMEDLLLRPLAAVLSHNSISRDRPHDRVAAFLIDDFGLLSHDRLPTFSFERFGDRSLNATTNFASRFVPDLSLCRIRLIAVQSLGNGFHDGVAFFAIGGLVDLSSHLILLIAIRDFVHHPVTGLLNFVVRGLVDGATDRIRLRLLNGVVDRSLTRLSFDAIGRIAASLLTRGRGTTAVTRRAAIASRRNGSR